MRAPTPRLLAALSAGLLLALGAGCRKPATGADSSSESGNGITVVGAFAYPQEAGADVGVAYVTIANNGTEDDRLMSAESPGVGEVEMHATVVADGVVKMEHRAAGFPIAAGQTLTMEPGGNHLMLMSVKSALVDGETMPITLHFEKAGSRRIEVAISEDGIAQ